MTTDMKSGWYNYRTGQFDYWTREESINFTDEQAKQYVPQMGGVGLFEVYRTMGKSVTEAMRLVLEAATKPRALDANDPAAS
jgi:hypothetical protein